MENMENKKNGFVKSQKSLYFKLKRINKLFSIHFSSLILLFLFCIWFFIRFMLIMYYFSIDEDVGFHLDSLSRTLLNINIIIGAIGLIFIVYQIPFYGSFIIIGKHYLKQVKVDRESHTVLYKGIVPYINNFYKFLNHYSKADNNMSNVRKKVRTFLILNIVMISFMILFFVNVIMEFYMDWAFSHKSIMPLIIFWIILLFWIINLITSLKIFIEIKKWEKLYPKLDSWAQELKRIPSKNSISLDEESSK